MDLIIAQQLLSSNLLWLVLVIIVLAILIWFLSWLLFPDPKSGAVPESLFGLDGLDEKTAFKLREYGIHSDRELMRLSSRGQQELESELGLHNGEYAGWRRQVLKEWRSAYLPSELRDCDAIYPDPELGGLYSKKPDDVDDLSVITGIDRATANRMNTAGIYTFQQLRLLTPEQRANLKRKFNLPGFSFDAVPQSDLTARSLGAASSIAARHASHLSDATSPSRAVTATNAESNASSSGADATTSEANIGGSSTGTSVLAESSLTESFSNPSVDAQIPTSMIDTELGRVYSSPPPHRDDLTELAGVDESAAAKLNAAGVYTVDQLLSLSPTQQVGFKRRFDLPHVNFGNWRSRHAAKKKLAGTANVAGTGSAPQSPPAAASRTSATKPADVANKDIGYVYVNPPANANDLTVLNGITPELAKRLNLNGIYTFEQLSSMSENQKVNFRQRFNLPGVDFTQWIPAIDSEETESLAQPAGVDTKPPAASHSISAADGTASTAVGFAVGTAGPADGPLDISTPENKSAANFTASPKFGRVYSAPPSHKNDFTKLGIDALTEKRMNSVGIYTYEQLNTLSSEQQVAVQSEFDLEDVNFTDWRRCINAWSRGIDTSLETKRVLHAGWLHGVRLPEIVPGVFDGHQLVAYPEQVVFRGSDPVHWGAKLAASNDGVSRALPASEIRSDINYIRIRRVDTRESVVTSVTKGQLFSPGPNDGNGWNGLCESFFGGRHLGVFAKDIPNEVETKFGIGGWGFGHRFDHNDQQEWAWAGRLLEPTTFEISVGHIGSRSGTVIFRSNDPSIWNQRVRDGGNRLAMPIDGVTHPISFLRLLRVDTGDAVVIRTDRESLVRRGENPRLGFNGLNDHFSGGHHLGIYHRDAPQDVEISFGEGGWGFGHPYAENDRQAYGWAGHAIGQTVFEISVLQQLPDYLQHELMG